MNNYPPEAGKMVTALQQFKAVSDVSVSLQPLSEIEVDDLSLPAPYSVLPHLTIRRSNGGNPHEALVSFEFRLAKDMNGWTALEFISWWVRDMSRGGYEMQLRPQAMPPEVAEEIQLGTSLTFILEIFYIEPDDDFMKIANYVGGLGDDLAETIEMYADTIQKVSS